MDTINSSAVYSFQEIAEMVRREVAKLELNGRTLHPEELKHIEILRQSLASLTELANTSKDTDLVKDENGGIILREGRYLAANAQFQAELRLDIGEAGIVSLDIYRGSVSSRSFLASLRSNPGEEIKPSQRQFGVIGEDEDGNQATGILEILPLSDTQATIKVTLNRGLKGLPVNIPSILSASWQSPYFRTIGLEIDMEEGVPPMPEYEFEERMVTVESCFEEAGLEIKAVGRKDIIPKTTQGWDAAQLHGLMTRFADESLNQKSWLLHLMVLTHAAGEYKDRLYGLMFDSGTRDVNGLPRQGAAIFTDPMKEHSAGLKRKMIQTTVHELGHALNLAHRFERAVGRADSTSCMNYDWRYLGGNRVNQFWREFRFGFDPDEVRFLRHGFRSALIPGGSEFHAINYWSDGTGSYFPYYREVEFPGLELRLVPPQNGGIFNFAQPVLLTIELKNNTGRSLDIPSQVLDPKSGFLEIEVRRIGLSNRNNSEKFTFSPLIHRCWDFRDMEAEVVPAGKTLRNNLNLTFGSTGFTFIEPGNYEVTAFLTFFDDVLEIEQVVSTNPLRIRVAHPQSLEEERGGMDLFCQDIGFYFALGGSDVLDDADNTLNEICQRRQKKAKNINDPLVANFIRTKAINFSRDFTVYEKGKFKTREADPGKAIELLSRLDDSAKKFFDPATLEGDRKLMNHLKKAVHHPAGS